MKIKWLYFSRDLARPCDQRVEKLYEWGPLMVTHHPAILGSDKHCGTGDVLKEFVSLTMVAMEM